MEKLSFNEVKHETRGLSVSVINMQTSDQIIRKIKKMVWKEVRMQIIEQIRYEVWDQITWEVWIEVKKL